MGDAVTIEPGQFWLTHRELWFIIAPYVEYDGTGTMWHVFRIPVLYEKEPSYQLMHDQLFFGSGARVVA